MLGLWEAAYKDLGTAEKLDYDEDIHEMLKQVKPNVSRVDLFCNLSAVLKIKWYKSDPVYTKDSGPSAMTGKK